MQQLGVCLEEDRRRHQVTSALRRFIDAYLARLEHDPSHHDDNHQTLWDLTFLQKLTRLWGKHTEETSDRLVSSITRHRDVSEHRSDMCIRSYPSYGRA